MREMTMKVLSPWKQHGGHPLPLLASQGGERKGSHSCKDWSYRNAATFIAKCFLLGQNHIPHAHIQIRRLQTCYWLRFLSLFIYFLFVSFLPFFLFYSCFLGRKSRTEAVSNHTLSSSHLGRHTLYFSMIVKPSSQLAPLCLAFLQTFDVLPYLEKSSTFSWFTQAYWGHPTSKFLSVAQMVKFSCVWVSRGCLWKEE